MKKHPRRFFNVLAFATAFLLALTQTPAATYYVSHSEGDDNRNGLASSPSGGVDGPWKTLAKASSVKFQPGDQLLLKCGDIWEETLSLAAHGAATQPITVASYGKGERPYIRRTIGNDLDCIVLKSSGGICFRDLELGHALTGIRILLAPTLGVNCEFFRFENCFFHDLDNPLFPPQAEDKSAQEGWALNWSGGIPNDIVVKNCIGLRTQGFFFDTPKNKLLFEGNTLAHTSLNQVNQTWGKDQKIYRNVFVYNYPWTYSRWGTTQILAGQIKADGDVRNDVIGNEFGWPGDYPGSPDGCGYDFEGPTENVTFQNNFVHNSYGEAILFMGKCAHNNLVFDNNILRNNVRFSPNPAWNFDVRWTPSSGQKQLKIGYGGGAWLEIRGGGMIEST